MGHKSTRVPAPPPRDPQELNTAERTAAVPRAGPGVSSIQAPATDKQPWNPAVNPYEFFSPNLDWGMDPRPQGGFVSYLRNQSDFPPPQQVPNQHAMLQNVHYAGGPSHYAPFAAPRPSVVRSSSLPKASIPPTSSGPQRSNNVETGEENGCTRTEKRLAWTSKEDERLMSAWLQCSTDPINGNNKKSDQYWGDVTSVFNSNTPKNRKREVKQAKDHWHSLNKLVYQFQCSWIKASAIYASGQSDAQLLEKAHAFYESDYKAQFHHMDSWRAVNEDTKWLTYNEWLEQSKKRKTSEIGETGKHTSSPIDLDDIDRPTGTKAAKAERNGKGKSKEAAADMELLEKLTATQEEAKRTRRDMMDMQQRCSSDKLEAARLSTETARLSAQAAKDNMEAKKQEKETEMMKGYRVLLMQDTIGMTDDMKNEYVKTLKVMREKLFGV